MSKSKNKWLDFYKFDININLFRRTIHMQILHDIQWLVKLQTAAKRWKFRKLRKKNKYITNYKREASGLRTLSPTFKFPFHHPEEHQGFSESTGSVDNKKPLAVY